VKYSTIPFFTFFAENFQQEPFSRSVFKDSRNNNDCTYQPNTQPKDSCDEKREDDQNASQDGANYRLLLPHVSCFEHRVHLFSLLEEVAVFFYSGSIPNLSRHLSTDLLPSRSVSGATHL
jgi:hypothetical protein